MTRRSLVRWPRIGILLALIVPFSVFVFVTSSQAQNGGFPPGGRGGFPRPPGFPSNRPGFPKPPGIPSNPGFPGNNNPFKPKFPNNPGFGGSKRPGIGNMFEHVWTCSKCGRELGRSKSALDRPNFDACPHCGTRFINAGTGFNRPGNTFRPTAGGNNPPGGNPGMFPPANTPPDVGQNPGNTPPGVGQNPGFPQPPGDPPVPPGMPVGMGDPGVPNADPGNNNFDPAANVPQDNSTTSSSSRRASTNVTTIVLVTGGVVVGFLVLAAVIGSVIFLVVKNAKGNSSKKRRKRRRRREEYAYE